MIGSSGKVMLCYVDHLKNYLSTLCDWKCSGTLSMDTRSYIKFTELEYFFFFLLRFLWIEPFLLVSILFYFLLNYISIKIVKTYALSLYS